MRVRVIKIKTNQITRDEDFYYEIMPTVYIFQPRLELINLPVKR